MKWSLVVLTAVAACHSVAQPGAEQPAPPTEARVDAGPVRDNVLDTMVDAAAKPASTPHWGRPPEASGDLFSVVDGACGNLNVSVLENETFVTFAKNAMARVTADGVVLDPLLSKGLENVNGLHRIIGHWPDRAYAESDNGGRCAFLDLASRWDGTQWRPAFALPEYMGVGTLQSYGSGALGIRECIDDCGERDRRCHAGAFMGDNAKAPPITGDGFRPTAYRTLPGGEVYAIGEVCIEPNPCGGQLRWWAPGKKLGYKDLSQGAKSLYAKSPSEVYLTLDAVLQRFDGTKLETLPAPGKTRNAILGELAGALWMEADGKVWERKADGSFDDVTPPSYGGSIVGLEKGVAWSRAKDAIYKRVSGAWQKVQLPRPPYTISEKAYLTPESIAVRAPDDVLVVASYFEQEPGWNEIDKRRTILRTKRPTETLRCSATGALQAWPPPATTACTTPFVFFSEVASSSPKDFDYPTTRKVLASRVAQIEGGEIAELRENGRVWNGVVPKSLADGRALAELYAKQFPMSRPEVVCATPTITRRIPIVR